MPTERRPNPNRSLESLEASLRAWPQPSVPADLEARLLAAVPAELPIAPRHWAFWASVVCASAAACLLAFFTWPGRDGKNPAPTPPTNESAHQVAPRPPDDNDRIAAWRQYRRVLDGGELPTFNWPLQGDVAQLGISLDSSRPGRLKEQNRPL